MTSEEIRDCIRRAGSAGSSEEARWLREIAFQLADMNERNEAEANLRAGFVRADFPPTPQPPAGTTEPAQAFDAFIKALQSFCKAHGVLLESPEEIKVFSVDPWRPIGKFVHISATTLGFNQ